MDVCCRLRWIKSFIVQSGRKLEAVVEWRASIIVTGNTVRWKKAANMPSEMKICKRVHTEKSVLGARSDLMELAGSQSKGLLLRVMRAVRTPSISSALACQKMTSPGPDHFRSLSHWDLLWLLYWDYSLFSLLHTANNLRPHMSFVYNKGQKSKSN